jgi:hypothetical protein
MMVRPRVAAGRGGLCEQVVPLAWAVALAQVVPSWRCRARGHRSAVVALAAVLVRPSLSRRIVTAVFDFDHLHVLRFRSSRSTSTLSRCRCGGRI